MTLLWFYYNFHMMWYEPVMILTWYLARFQYDAITFLLTLYYYCFKASSMPSHHNAFTAISPEPEFTARSATSPSTSSAVSTTALPTSSSARWRVTARATCPSKRKQKFGSKIEPALQDARNSFLMTKGENIKCSVLC